MRRPTSLDDGRARREDDDDDDGGHERNETKRNFDDDLGDAREMTNDE